MQPTIRVQPAREQMRAFAGWAVEQRPKVRTVAPNAFGVPADLFVQIPEPLLIGALIDGHRYVSPDEDAATGTLPPGTEDPVAIPRQRRVQTGTEDRQATTPQAPAEGDSREATAVLGDQGRETFVPLSRGDEEQQGGPFLCETCSREFTSERGRDTHSRLKHPEA